EFVEAKESAGGGSLIAAAREFGQRRHGAPVPKPVAEVVREIIAAKKADGLSMRHVQTLRSHLNRFAAHFQMPIGTVLVNQMDDWLRRLSCGARARNNIRLSIITLFRYAKRHGYLSKMVPTEAESVSKARDRGGKIDIFSPEQLAELLQDGNDEARLWLALGAFTGMRHEELLRLQWQ